MAYDQQVKRTINSTDVVPTINASPQAKTTGTITTSSSTITATDLSGVGSVIVLVSGTYAGVNVTFEASPNAGTTWVAVNGEQVTTRAITSSGATGALTNNSTVAYSVSPLTGYDQFRVRATAWTSGTANVVIHPSTQFVEIPFATQPVSGTVTANWGTITTGTTYNVVSAASTNAASVKSSAGSLFELTVSNVTATAMYVKLYNKASAPTVGTDVPVLTIPAAAGATVTTQFGTIGKRFATGIAIAVTAAAAATDTANAVAGAQINATYI